MSVKITYLDGSQSLICSRVLMIAETSAMKIEAKAGNLMLITVFDGEMAAQTIPTL